MSHPLPNPTRPTTPTRGHTKSGTQDVVSKTNRLRSANRAKSHGPKTEEGRRISSRNAVKHGLYLASVLISTESREEYHEVLDAYVQQFQPEGPVELDLVEEMVAAKWR